MDLSLIAQLLSSRILLIIAILILFSFLPPIAYMVWIRNTERYGREPWSQVVKTFIWGAVFAVIIAILLSFLLVYLFQKSAERVYISVGENPTLELIVLAMVIAPLVEELAKGIGVYTAARTINEAEDGLVYGASSGLGFSATENLLYGAVTYIAEGLGASLILIGIRSISSALLHASATSTMGYGIGKSIVWGGRHHVLPYYLLAVIMHASFNFLASLGVLYQERYGEAAALFGFLAALLFAFAAIGLVRRKIVETEMYRYRHPF